MARRDARDRAVAELVVAVALGQPIEAARGHPVEQVVGEVPDLARAFVDLGDVADFVVAGIGERLQIERAGAVGQVGETAGRVIRRRRVDAAGAGDGGEPIPFLARHAQSGSPHFVQCFGIVGLL